MKTKKWNYRIGLAGAAAVLAGVIFAYGFRMDSALSVLSFPFVVLGDRLRSLSLHSELGNAAAVILYAVVSLFPSVWFWKRTNHKGYTWILPCMSLWLFYMIYNLINPGFFIRNHMPDLMQGQEALPVFQMAMSILFYSMWAAYLMCSQADKMKRQREQTLPDEWAAMQLHRILGIAAGGITCFYAYTTVFLIRNICSSGEKDSLWIVEETAWQQDVVTADQVLGIFRLVLSLIPAALAVFLIIRGMELLEELGDQESKIRAEKAEQLSKYSLGMVYTVLICDFLENGIQFLLCPYLSQTDFSLNISFLPLILAFSARILAGHFRKNKELQEENDLFI